MIGRLVIAVLILVLQNLARLTPEVLMILC